MSLDPPFTAEFADAGYLADIPDDVEQSLTEQHSREPSPQAPGAASSRWPRSGPTLRCCGTASPLSRRPASTWPSRSRGTRSSTQPAKRRQVAVQSNKYEGYVVWINALISGAGGNIVEHRGGADAEIDIDSDAGGYRADHRETGAIQGRTRGPLGRQRGPGRHHVRIPRRSFLVNWTYICTNYPDNPK